MDDDAKPAAKPAASAGADASREPPPGGDESNKPADGGEQGSAAAEPADGATSRGLAANAACPGSTQTRNAQRDSARRNLDGGVSYDGQTTQHGDTVLGVKHVYYQATHSRRELRASHLPLDDVNGVLGTYVGAKPSIGRPWTVALLRGAPGSGRYAAALAILNDPHQREVLRLDPKTVLEALADDRLTHSAGYVLDGKDGAALTAFEVQRLDAELRHRDCQLVITVSDRFTPVDAALVDRMVSMPDPPEPLAVIRAHLNWHGSRRGTNLTRLLQDSSDEILALLPETANGIGDYALLGKALADAAGDLDFVRRRLALRDLHDFEAWFDGLSNLYSKCFAISLAALNALPHQAVAEAARKLELLLDPVDERQKRAEPAKPFQIGRRRLLDEVRASVATRTIESQHGETPAEVVTFVDPSYPRRLLNYVWQEHDHVRGPLLEWLRGLGAHASDAVRIAAATAIGVLAVSSFDFVRAKVLVTWARHKNWECRESAAIALEGPGADEALGRTVGGMVEEWARSGQTALVATAARSCGVALGKQDPEKALKLLDDLIVAEDLAIIESYCRSLAEWVGGDDGVLRSRGITAVHDWSVDRDHERRTAGQFAFLWMALDLITEDDPWPALLKFAITDGTIAKQVIALWSAALVNPELSEFARRVLAEWAATVNKDEMAVTAFADLCRRASSRSQVVIKHQARNWQRADGQPCPRTAAAILHAVI